ncbi:hypothetical protein CLAFUR4_03765 [Fulvia fulva]|nr:hypothetical protein CLAFUR4_03765 [Fulvia fulva]WPV26830.1 hypothetical protein CLAFUW7_03769 [Fulvia fulva]
MAASAIDAVPIRVTSSEQLASVSSSQPQNSQDLELVLLNTVLDEEASKRKASSAEWTGSLDVNSLSSTWRKACSQGPIPDVLCSFRCVKFDLSFSGRSPPPNSGVKDSSDASRVGEDDSRTDDNSGAESTSTPSTPSRALNVYWETTAPTSPRERDAHLVKEMDVVHLVILLANILRMRVQRAQAGESRRLVFKLEPGTLPLGPRNDLERALYALSMAGS